MNDANGTKPSDRPQGLSRRQFIKLSGVSGLALGLVPGLGTNAKPSVSSSDATTASATEEALELLNQPSEFLRIAPDGRVTIQINRLEFSLVRGPIQVWLKFLPMSLTLIGV